MDRLAKGMRAVSGLVLFANIAAFFLPLTKITQPNYPDINYAPFHYMKGLFQGAALAGGEQALSSWQITTILALMLFPALLSLIAGIYGVVGGPRQLFTSISALIIMGLYGALYYFLPGMWPAAGAEQVYVRGLGLYTSLGVSGLSAVFGVIAWIVTPRVRKKENMAIPQIQEIREEQIQAKYNILGAQEEPASPPQVPGSNSGSYPGSYPGPDPAAGSAAAPGGALMPPYDPLNPRGVLVGYTGMYAGAEIPFGDGETISLGRLSDNDLVFEGQGHVSRKHCALTWYGDRKKFQIRDYSTSGSYINQSEECLPHNIDLWLEPGTVIDFGNAENRFRLE